MRIENLDSNKSRLAREFFYKDGDKVFKSNVKLCGENFEIYEPNFCGGSIQGNCNFLESEEFKIINSLKKEYLEKIESEIEYIKKLINTRKNEILEPETETILITKRFKEGNKKIYSIYVEQYERIKDIYGDCAIQDRRILEDYRISDTKQFQDEIENMIKELENKYNIKRQ